MEGSPQTEIYPSIPVLQAANDVLRRQVRAAVSQEQKVKALQEQVSHMEHSAETGSVELLTLRRALAQRDAQVSAQPWIWRTLLIHVWLCCGEALLVKSLLVKSLKATTQGAAASVASVLQRSFVQHYMIPTGDNPLSCTDCRVGPVSASQTSTRAGSG